MKLYLAYGSNLNVAQMKRRCPDAKAVGVGVLKDSTLIFRGRKNSGYLTVDDLQGLSVKVGVWEISEADEKRLDIYEGYPSSYIKEYKEIEYRRFDDGQNATATGLIYRMPQGKFEVSKPREEYIKTCARGYLDFGMDINQLYDAVELTRVALYKETPTRSYAL